jgi:ketosteroid isomerase-like protein
MSDTGVTDKVEEVVSKAKSRFGRGDDAADLEGRPGVVREALRKFGAGDIDGFLEVMDDKVEWESPNAGNFPGGGDYCGTDEVRERFIGDAGRTFTEFGFVPESYFDSDEENTVVALGRFVGKGVEGDNLDADGVLLCRFDGDTTMNRIVVITDSAAFPEVVTEKKQKEWEEEDRENERKEQEKDTEGKGEDETEGKSEDKSEAKGESDDEKQKDDDSDDD